MLRGTLGKPNTKLATFAAKGLQPCVAPWIRGSRNLLGLVCDWPNRSPIRALPAPPTAARHVVGGGRNRWLERDPVCQQRSVGSLQVGSSGRGKGTRNLSDKDILSFYHWKNKSKKQNPLSTLCWVVVLFLFVFFFSFLIIRVVGSFFLSFVLFCF